jgi:hypothetical protein
LDAASTDFHHSCRKGVADEQLAKKEEGRGRKRDREDSNSPPSAPRKRSRSVSSFSSVSTISTTLSQTPPLRRSAYKDEPFHLSQRSPPPLPARPSSRKRQRSPSSSLMSYSSASSYKGRRSASEGLNRNTRRKHGSSSPGERGRRRSRSRSIERKPNRYYRSRSIQLSRVARNRRSLTPEETTRDSYSSGIRPDRRMRDRTPTKGDWSPRLDHRDNDRYGSSNHRVDENRLPRDTKRVRIPHAARDRSLSPFSKRLALTQAMNMGR